MDGLKEVITQWAKANRINPGHLASMLNEIATDLVTVKATGNRRPRPTKGLICKGMWWPGQIMKWRVMNLETHEVVIEETEFKGTHNVAEYMAIMEAVKWADEHESDLPIYSASYVAIAWIKKKTFNTSKQCPKWIEDAVGIFTRTAYPRHLVEYWNSEEWGPTPADFSTRDYRQEWNAR